MKKKIEQRRQRRVLRAIIEIMKDIVIEQGTQEVSGNDWAKETRTELQAQQDKLT